MLILIDGLELEKDGTFNKIRKGLGYHLLLKCQKIGYMDSKGEFEQSAQLLL